MSRMSQNAHLAFGLIAIVLLFASPRAEAGLVCGQGTVMGKRQQVCYSDGWDDPGGGPVGSGPRGAGPVGGDNGADQYCPILLRSKPSGCASEGAIQGADYASDKFMIGSGLATALSNLSNSSITAQSRGAIQASLAQHTVDLSDIRRPLNEVNRTLIDGLVQACELQSQHDAANPPFSPHPSGVSPGLKACLATVSRVNGEADSNFGSFFQTWLHTKGIVLSDLGIPQTIINWFAPENSLNVKFEKANEQKQCNLWFKEVRENGC